MASLSINGSALGSALQNLLMCDEIVPGSAPSYQICKEIYLYHPLGAKMAEAPIKMAQSQERIITIPKGPEERVVQAFKDEWNALGASDIILNTRAQSRVYGIASVVVGEKDGSAAEPIDFAKLATLPREKLYFNVFDPLNTAGSLVLDQNPNSPAFQKPQDLAVQGQRYHRSRSCVIMNESPIYIAYTGSAFGYTGRSVYQRALFPLKSFVQTMVTDDLVSRKAGLIVAKLKQVGSIIDGIMGAIAGVKRQLLKEAQVDNVLSIATEESIETLDMKNLDGAYGMARKNILENVAVSADMPAKLLNSETFAEGFGEGTEDAKQVARYIDRERIAMQPLYDFFDPIVQYRAWTEEFYKGIQADFPDDYGKIDYQTAVVEWRNSFSATWPNLLTEPDSEKVKTEDTKLKGIISLVEVLLPAADPANRSKIIEWAADSVNEMRLMFPIPLNLDWDALAAYQPEDEGELGDIREPNEPRPFASQDSVSPAVLRSAMQEISARRTRRYAA